MRRAAVLMVTILLPFTASRAAIITLDNTPHSVGDYTTLQAAHDAASSGDTIYVYPSNIRYATIALTKRLMIFGVGFDIHDTPSSRTACFSGNMTFNAGSQGSLLEGLDGQFNVTIQTSDITVKRNDLDHIGIYAHGISGVSILQNNVAYVYCSSSADDTDAYVLNNRITGGPGAIYFYGSSGHTWTFVNNVIAGDWVGESAASAFILTNNIIRSGTISSFFTGVDSKFTYNMSNSEQLPAGDGNLTDVDMATVFVNEASDFHLKPGSPAIGAGENGVDMGMYGGPAPYVDGGMPGLPCIYELESSPVGSQQTGLDVTIKARSNTE